MDFITCLKTRRSVRRFADKPVSRAVLTEAVSLAQFAPSWKNSQTVRFLVVDDPALKDRIAEEGVMGFAKNAGTLKNAPAMVIVTTVHGICGYNEDGTPATVKGSHWESFDAGLATQSFCLAAHELGLGSVIMGIFDPDKVAELAQVPEGQLVSCVLAVGYPGEGPHGKAVRKPVEEVLSFR